jgi:hypothetical protein
MMTSRRLQEETRARTAERLERLTALLAARSRIEELLPLLQDVSDDEAAVLLSTELECSPTSAFLVLQSPLRTFISRRVGDALRSEVGDLTQRLREVP